LIFWDTTLLFELKKDQIFVANYLVFVEL